MYKNINNSIVIQNCCTKKRQFSKQTKQEYQVTQGLVMTAEHWQLKRVGDTSEAVQNRAQEGPLTAKGYS